MSAPEEVTAEVIEPVNLAKAPEPAIAYTLPTVTIGNTAEIDGFVASVETFFATVEIDPTDRDQAKQLADVAADVKKAADAINSKRIKMDKDIKSATAESAGTLNVLRDRLMGVYDGMRRQVKEAEDLQKQARLNLLAGEYEAVAPDLAKLIPLESFIAKDKKLVSISKSFTGDKACNLLDEMVAEAVHDRARIMEGDVEFSTEADMVYCKTLDLRMALDENDRLKRAKAEREAHMQETTRLEEAIGKAHEAVSAATPPSPDPMPESRREPSKRYLFHLEFVACEADCNVVRDFMRSLPKLDGKLFKKVREA